MQLHLPALAQISEVEVTALADADAERLNAAGNQWGVGRRCADYRTLLHDPSVDAVLITVPTPFHCEVFLAAAATGKHIYIEKPLAMHLKEADQMLAAAAHSAACRVVGFNLRSHRLVQKARDIIRTGALGPIVSVRTVWVGGPQDRPAWQRRRAEGGGAIYELGIHHFDLWRFLLNTEVAHVEAPSLSDDSDDARVAVTARLLNGALACSVFALRGVVAHEVEVIGESASLCFSLYRADSLEIRPAGRFRQLTRWLQQLPAAAKAARRGGDYPDSYRTHWLRFLESTRDGEPPATLHDGREALRIALAAMDSSHATFK
jgi:myo-inositol 2-dehydrogenase/D-chiro-inositol 1-dehydrogenase